MDGGTFNDLIEMTKAKEFIGKYENVYKVKYNGEILYNVLLEDLLYEIFIYDNNYNLSEKDIVNVKINGIKWHQLEVKAIIV